VAVISDNDVAHNCPECTQVALFAVQYPQVECLCCGCRWQLVRPPPEDLSGEQHGSRLKLLDERVAAGRRRVGSMRNLARSLNKDHPAEARTAEQLADLLAVTVRLLGSVQRTVMRLQAKAPSEDEPTH